MRRYGVFRLGQIWSVVSDDGTKRGFPTRPHALAAAESMLDEVRAQGAHGEAVIQDEAGRMITTDTPTRFIGLTSPPSGSAWDQLDRPAATGRPPRNPRP